MTVTQRHLLETYTGRFVDYTDPDSLSISVEDIAHALAMTCRFGGHVKKYYSVAEHSLFVCRLLDSGSARRLCLAGLFHDGHEAYLGDLPTPLKNAVGPEYRAMADGLDYAIASRIGVPQRDFHADAVKWADAVALRIEAHLLKNSAGTDPEWDAAWDKHGLHSIEHVEQLCRVLGNRGRIDDLALGMEPDVAERAFLAEYERQERRRWSR